MDFSAELHLAAGLGALGLGAGALLRDPARPRNRLFALLCGALVLWNLGVALSRTPLAPEAPWHLLYLLGSCASAPVALHFCLVLTGRATGARPLLAASYAAAALLWASAWTPLRARQPAWNLAAALLLGAILLLALAAVLRQLRSLATAPERSAYRLLLAGAAVAVVGGLSDFLPRDLFPLPSIGSAAVLVLLLVICAVVVRHRFLDVDAFLVRSVALLVGAAGASLFLYSIARSSGDQLLPLFLGTFIILLAARPLGEALVSGLRAVLGGSDTVARALITASQRLSVARDPGELWRILGEGLRPLEGEAHVALCLTGDGEDAFRSVYATGEGSASTEVPRGSALPAFLDRERAPVTRMILEERARDARGAAAAPAARALEQMRELGLELAVPLHRGERLVGWIGAGGGRSDRYLRDETAAAFLALGNQAVTILERMEALDVAKRREALAAVGEMAAGLAHEIRNPLSAIQGAAQVIRGESDPGRASEMLQVLEEESSRLGRFVGEFLDYARPGAARREPVDLGELARRALRLAETSGAKLHGTVSLAEGTPRALGDPEQLLRVFGNLVRNAWEAAGAGGTVAVRVAPAGSRRVTIRFEDDGPGIPPEEIPKLFQPFHTTKPGGTGLGLALVHRIVETQGGEVRVEGRPGAGAVFTVTLPAEERSE